MIIALDSNILLRIAESSNANHSLAVEATEKLAQEGHELRLLPQVIYEFWVVATRTLAANGLELAAQEVIQFIDKFMSTMPVLFDDELVFDTWWSLAKKYQITGVPNHDLRIAAAMVAHQVPVLLTFNAAHFKRITEIEVLEPAEVNSWLSGQVNNP